MNSKEQTIALESKADATNAGTMIGRELDANARSADDRPQIRFVREVLVRYRGARRTATCVASPANAAKFIRPILPDNAREHFVTVYLNGRHEIAGYSVTATGTANSCPVHPREVYQAAVLTGAIAIIVSHNHPSGSCLPSEDDRKLTRKLREAGELLGIKLLDHIVLSDLDHYSFSEHGEI